MPEPGWIPPDTDKQDDCFRAAFSCVTGVHPRRLRYIEPAAEQSDKEFWDAWRLLAYERGFSLELLGNYQGQPLGRQHAAPWPFGDDEFWIRQVQSYFADDWEHAVVMRGQKLHYDCSHRPRVRRPSRINSIWEVVPLG